MAMAGMTLMVMVTFNSTIFLSKDDDESIGISRRFLSAESATATGVVLGWVMCAVYVCSRIPQIRLMINEQNVDGISPLFFF
eukprot:UN24028